MELIRDISWKKNILISINYSKFEKNSHKKVVKRSKNHLPRRFFIILKILPQKNPKSLKHSLFPKILIKIDV